MSRITKDLAEQIAYKLTEASRLAADALKKDYEELATIIYESQTPDEIKGMLKKYPDWFYTRRGIQLNGHGFGWDSVTATRPVICNSNTDCLMKMTAAIGDKLIKAKRKHEKAYKEYKDLKSETENALLALRTYNRIREEIPAAAPFLPPPMSNALVCNFDSLNKKLQKQLQTTTEKS